MHICICDLHVAKQFGQRWNFHHACGALDGKHIASRNAPKNYCTIFYYYKVFFSIVLLGLVDSEYRFP